jgi:hypothetical protein
MDYRDKPGNEGELVVELNEADGKLRYIGSKTLPLYARVCPTAAIIGWK